MAENIDLIPGKKPETREFIKRMKEYTLSISGMGFQDVWNVDIGRLKGCCVHIATAKGNMIPLCAFHMTNAHGEWLYT